MKKSLENTTAVYDEKLITSILNWKLNHTIKQMNREKDEQHLVEGNQWILKDSVMYLASL